MTIRLTLVERILTDGSAVHDVRIFDTSGPTSIVLPATSEADAYVVLEMIEEAVKMHTTELVGVA
jgi:hypothetical protein